MNDNVHLIPIRQIHIWKRRQCNQERFRRILQSIKTIRVVEPIQVFRLPEAEPDGQVYRLIDGHLRIDACNALGVEQIPAVVHPSTKQYHE